MSTGGYTYSKYTWSGGSSETELTRLTNVLSNIVQTLCSNSNWSMDTRYHSSSSDYTPSSVTMYNYSYTPDNDVSYPGINKICFLKTNDLYLAIGYTSGSGKFSPNDLIFEPTEKLVNGELVMHNAITGLYFSLSTSGTWTTDSTYGITLPSDATKWSSFGRVNGYFNGSNGVNGDLNNFVRDNTSGLIYSYSFITKGNHLAIIAKCNVWGASKIKCIVAGNLIGALAHSSDQKTLCCIALTENKYDVDNSTSSLGNRGESIEPEYSINNDRYLNQETNYFVMSGDSNSNTQIFRQDGSIANPYDETTNTGVGLSISNTIQLSSTICSPISGGSRWCPLQVYIKSSNPGQYGVVANDGFKGYLDTDFLRAITINEYNLGSTFGSNEDFIYIGAGLIIGWSNSNTEVLYS